MFFITFINKVIAIDAFNKQSAQTEYSLSDTIPIAITPVTVITAPDVPSQEDTTSTASYSSLLEYLLT